MFRVFITIGLLLTYTAGYTQDWQSERAELQGIDDQVQTLKKEVIAINKELSLLEEKLLFPSTTQLAIFLSISAKPGFRLDSAELTVNGQVVSNHIYTFRELESLFQGGVQRLHTGNVTTGNHNLQLVVRGVTAGGAPYVEKATGIVKKEITPKFVELQVDAGGGKPSVKFKDW